MLYQAMTAKKNMLKGTVLSHEEIELNLAHKLQMKNVHYLVTV
jgi:hypothetical protein